jgi:mRNA interferase MazF
MNRGDFVLVDYPYSDRTGSKVRPALVVQADTLNHTRADTILAIVTSQSSGRVAEYLVDLASDPGAGLLFNSFVQCDTLVTLDQSLILRVLGALSPAALGRVDACLKAALGLT